MYRPDKMKQYLYHMIGGGSCSLCGSPGTNKSTCPLNPNAKKPNPNKHPLATKTVPKTLKTTPKPQKTPPKTQKTPTKTQKTPPKTQKTPPKTQKATGKSTQEIGPELMRPLIESLTPSEIKNMCSQNKAFRSWCIESGKGEPSLWYDIAMEYCPDKLKYLNPNNRKHLQRSVNIVMKCGRDQKFWDEEVWDDIDEPVDMYSLLRDFAKKGLSKLVKRMIDTGAFAPESYQTLGRALEAAVYEGHIETVKIFLDAIGNDNWQALHESQRIATEIPDADMLSFLIDYGGLKLPKTYLGGDDRPRGHKPFIGLTESRGRPTSLEIVKILVDAGVDADSFALREADKIGRPDIAKFLLDAGARHSK